MGSKLPNLLDLGISGKLQSAAELDGCTLSGQRLRHCLRRPFVDAHPWGASGGAAAGGDGDRRGIRVFARPCHL